MPKTKDDLGLLIRATHFAARRHRDQRRKDIKSTPYITHPIALAATLSDAGVSDVTVLAAALLHDTIEDTITTYDDLRGEFGKAIADLVAEVTDAKFVEKASRKRLQVARAGHASEGAKLVKLADKICNLRDMLGRPPAHWSLERRQRYFDWADEVIGQVRGTNATLERMFARLYRQRPVA
jgi:GTP diphosphokinase / guanosine-3',5'-bis(diphosphate) 3'-diphosphatase